MNADDAHANDANAADDTNANADDANDVDANDADAAYKANGNANANKDDNFSEEVYPFPVLSCGGSTRKNVIFSNSLWTNSEYLISLKTCQYDPCKVLLKKMTPSLPINPPTSAFFGISDWTSD
jgi:hypothetical protein